VHQSLIRIVEAKVTFFSVSASVSFLNSNELPREKVWMSPT
jgi:hypothetical protein